MKNPIESLGLTLSIFRRELLAIPRRKRFYLKRIAFLSFFGLLLLINYFSSSGNSASGLAIFRPLALTTLVAVLMITPTAASSLVTREREERTLGLLFLSDISGARFVIGKILTSLFSMGSLVFATLPFFILVVSLGGISVAQVITTFIILATSALLGASTGLFGSCCARTQRIGDIITGCILILYLLIFPILLAILYANFGDRVILLTMIPQDFIMSLISPCVALYGICDGGAVSNGLLNSAVNVLLSIPLLLLSRVMIMRTVISKEKPPISAQISGRVKSYLRVKNLFTVPPLISDPVCWKEFDLMGGGHKTALLKFALSIIIPLGLLLMFKVKVQDFSWDDFIGIALGFCCFMSAGAAALGTINGLGGAFVKDRQTRTIEMLFTTDLTDGEIIGGKVKAVLMSVLPWIIAAPALGFILFLKFIVTTTDNEWLGYLHIILFILLDICSTVLSYAAFALWLSLRSKKNHALAICIIATFIYMPLCLPFLAYMCEHLPEAIPVLDAMLHGAVAVAFLTSIKTSFRSTVLKHLG